MSSPDFTELLQGIQKSAQLVGKRRGEHAAALWSISDFLGNLSSTLVPYRDDKPLWTGGPHLAVAPPEGAAVELVPGEKIPRWGLFLSYPDRKVPAPQAPPRELVAAVKRLPDFLAHYAKELHGAAGSELSTSQAKRFVNAVCELSTQV